MRPMFKLLFVAVLAQVFSSHASENYFQEKVKEGLGLLPFSYAVEFEVSSFKSDQFMGENLCELGEHVEFGKTLRKHKKHKIIISARLVELAQTVTRVFSCSHGSFEKVLLATIVHELTHVRDNFEKISLDPDFQRIVGVKRITKSSRKKILNQNVATSPDPYEFISLEEALATNVEYLIFDPEFECRKPATANFLAPRLGITLSHVCRKNYQVITQSSYIEDNYLHHSNIDPSRIYQVHYLFAGKGQALMSRWGHAMFRLVVCAPHRTTAGPECLRDVSHHLVLTYRAYITDMNISYSKGMFGDYPSQLFIMRFHEVQQEYTKFELRDLYSVPLKMTEEQKKNFIDLTLERYWTYQGKYYFLDNNCGTEAQKHLAVVLSEEEARLVRSITPSKMFNDIIDSGLSLDKGQLYRGLYDEMEKTFRELRSIGLYKQKKLIKFLKKGRAETRLESYKDYFSRQSLDSKTLKRTVMRLIYLERYLLTRFMQELPKKAFLKMNKDASLKAVVQKMSEGLKTLALQPWEVVDGKYGVPTANEFEVRYTEFKERRKSEMKVTLEEQLRNLNIILEKKHFSNEMLELEKFREIKNFTNDLLLRSNQLQESL